MTWPTIRFLKSLSSGWTDPSHESSVKREAWNELPLLTDLGHPALQVCLDFVTNPGGKKYCEHKASTKQAGYKVFEARDLSKGPGWRTAIIRIQDVAWAVFADAHDKFHASAPNAFRGSRRADLEPNVFDLSLRKIKLDEASTSALIESWQRELIHTVLELFKSGYLMKKGHTELHTSLPEPPACLLREDNLSLNLEVRLNILHDDREEVLEEEEQKVDALVELELRFTPWAADEELENTIITTLLPILNPREEVWTSKAASYDKSGSLSLTYDISVERASQLIFAAESDDNSYTDPQPAQQTHQAHYIVGGELAASVVECRPIRSVCGVWFVSSRVPDGLPICADCIEALPDASLVHEMLHEG